MRHRWDDTADHSPARGKVYFRMARSEPSTTLYSTCTPRYREHRSIISPIYSITVSAGVRNHAIIGSPFGTNIVALTKTSQPDESRQPASVFHIPIGSSTPATLAFGSVTSGKSAGFEMKLSVPLRSFTARIRTKCRILETQTGGLTFVWHSRGSHNHVRVVFIFKSLSAGMISSPNPVKGRYLRGHTRRPCVVYLKILSGTLG